MNTSTSADQVETVEAAAARYEAEHDARELALMLAQERADRNAVAQQNHRAAVRNLTIARVGAGAALAALVTVLVVLLAL